MEAESRVDLRGVNDYREPDFYFRSALVQGFSVTLRSLI